VKARKSEGLNRFIVMEIKNWKRKKTTGPKDEKVDTDFTRRKGNNKHV